MSKNMHLPTEGIDMAKVELARPQIKNKVKIWFSFIFFGWSYGSLGRLGLQVIWYLIPLIGALGIYQNLVNNQFTVLTSIALVGMPLWFIWMIFRVFTLNRSIDHYNMRMADYFGLNAEERHLLDINE